MHISCVFITILTVSAVSQRLPIAKRSVKYGSRDQAVPETHIFSAGIRFLVGSEFEQSMVSHLLNSSTTTTLNDDITSLLASTNLTYTLAEPEKPFVFVERNYFWSQAQFNEFADADNISAFAYVCVYNVTQEEGIFSQMSRVRVLSTAFSCKKSSADAHTQVKCGGCI
uniref:Uncharacterized protein n=1 Tax=Caenorhabditis japonica TaxID=281687 RepID=A0A8R1IXF2_CAEJA